MKAIIIIEVSSKKDDADFLGDVEQVLVPSIEGMLGESDWYDVEEITWKEEKD